MTIKEGLKHLPTAATVGIGLFIVGCGTGGNVTNCLTQAEYLALLASVGITQCGPGGPCAGGVGIQVNYVYVDRYVCAYYHNARACGTPNGNGCNTYAEVTGTVEEGTSQIPECDETCFNEGDISAVDTGIPCSAPNPPSGFRPCVDLSPPG